ncbi:MAG: tRNA (N6-threonylcarbamoyladenosine(37)-N6)-methyltransferase TrmO [Ruminococcaceae bacterium]|nr:tRNA (N6-threonylcarbamoyladenosine(37)-N6)-methyltransferase TrmO [Oscillospiraceae bacterium]
MNHEMKIIARIRTDFPDKFGIPRQSGLLGMLESRIEFEPEYRVAEALRGIEEWSHLWLIWQFSENVRDGFSPTVRPPRLGGNTRVGVFATRSPFRPNPIGLSCVKLVRREGTTLIVTGADMVDGTPIYDIKPYLPYADAHPEARGGFAEAVFGEKLTVEFPPELLARLPENKREAAVRLLAEDPRPAVRQGEPERIFGLRFAGFEIKFQVDGDRLTVVYAEPY